MPGLVPGTLSSSTHSLTKYFVKLNIVKKYKKYNITQNKLSQKYNMYGLVPGTLSYPLTQLGSTSPNTLSKKTSENQILPRNTSSNTNISKQYNMYNLVPHLATHPLPQINITRFVKKEQLIFSFIKYKEPIIIQKYNIDKNKHFEKYEHAYQRNHEKKH